MSPIDQIALGLLTYGTVVGIVWLLMQRYIR